MSQLGELANNVEVQLRRYKAAVAEHKAHVESHGGYLAGQALLDDYKAILAGFNIHGQVYWNGHLVGPDVMRFLEHFPDIMEKLKEVNKTEPEA